MMYSIVDSHHNVSKAIMYVQLTIELITKAIELFCKKEVKKRDARKVYASLVEDVEVEKHYFCGTICIKSKNVCMKQVDEEDKRCHVHDPNRKCQGFTVKGEKCGSVAKMGDTHCWRHRGKEEYTEKRTTKRATPKRKTVEKKSPGLHTPEYVVDSEESAEDESSSDEESAEDEQKDVVGEESPTDKQFDNKQITQGKRNRKEVKRIRHVTVETEDEAS